MVKRIINWLYRKYCKPPQLDTLYLNGVQRDFSKEVTPNDQQVRRNSCIEFVGSGACRSIMNEALKEYVEGLFNVGESQKIRDQFHININVIIKLEKLIESYAVPPGEEEEFDEHNPL